MMIVLVMNEMSPLSKCEHFCFFCSFPLHSKEPTDAPTKSPIAMPTKSPTKKPTEVPVTAVEVEPKVANLPPCPPHYSTLTAYAAGDTIESDLHIYKCQDAPYEEYCNVAKFNEDWSDTDKQFWIDAWIHVSACVKLVTEGELTTAVDEVTEAITTTTTTSSTEVSTVVTSTTAQAPICPSIYDPFKKNYIAGNQVMVKCDIFRCRDKEHEEYCNIAAWNDSLLARSEGAKELWMNAWEQLGACSPTLEELMELAASDVSWDCNINLNNQGAMGTEVPATDSTLPTDVSIILIGTCIIGTVVFILSSFFISFSLKESN